ncbi:MAG TPA: ester cyclase [Actinomycetes bacterium]
MEIEQLDDQGMAAWDRHDVAAFVDLLAPDFVWTDLTLPEPMRSRDQARQYMQAWFTAFPDMRVKQTNRVVGDDAVAAELEFTGTNSGPMMMGGMEIPPTGKSVLGRGSYFVRVEHGKIVRFSTHPDVAGMMMQLGLMPSM